MEKGQCLTSLQVTGLPSGNPDTLCKTVKSMKTNFLLLYGLHESWWQNYGWQLSTGFYCSKHWPVQLTSPPPSSDTSSLFKLSLEELSELNSNNYFIISNHILIWRPRVHCRYPKGPWWHHQCYGQYTALFSCLYTSGPGVRLCGSHDSPAVFCPQAVFTCLQTWSQWSQKTLCLIP